MRTASWTLDARPRLRRVWRHRRAPRSGWIALGLAAAAGGMAGCVSTVPGEDYRNVERQLTSAKEEIARLEQQLAAEQENARQLREQLAAARGLDKELLDQLVVPERIEIVSPSGGYDDDGKTGDDGLVLYVQPIDRDGHAVKTAGSFKVTMLDLTDPTEPKVIAPYEFDVPTTRSLWYGRLWTNHFKLRCPWPPSGGPQAREVTVRVSFTILLTGTTLDTQGVYPVSLGPKRDTTAAVK